MSYFRLLPKHTIPTKRRHVSALSIEPSTFLFLINWEISEPSVGARLPIMEFHPIIYLYSILQWILDKLLSPTPPPPHARLHRPRIAIIGAGLTGVSSASHCVGHGFDVTIFEADDEKSLGGIWSVSLLPMMQLDVANPSSES